MRRLEQEYRQERGAMAVVVAFIAIPLLVCLAFVVDAGLLHWEKAQLQNGADAAALAVAQDCAVRGIACEGGAEGYAAGMASSNANDDESGASFLEFEVEEHSGEVTVRAATPVGNEIAHPFISLIAPGEGSRLQATASARWGTPVSGGVLPYTIGTCEFNDARLLSGQEVVIENTNRTTCPGTGSPGGFGWLDSPTGCEIELGLGDLVYGDTGSWGSNSGCDLSEIELCGIILVPVYDVAARNADGTGTPSGANAYYRIEKFAAFVFNGWKQSGGAGHSGACPGVTQLFNTAKPTGGRWPNSGIQGHFVRFVALDEAFEIGPGPNAGVTKVEFTG